MQKIEVQMRPVHQICLGKNVKQSKNNESFSLVERWRECAFDFGSPELEYEKEKQTNRKDLRLETHLEILKI